MRQSNCTDVCTLTIVPLGITVVFDDSYRPVRVTLHPLAMPRKRKATPGDEGICLAYVRVSTDKQENGPEAQRVAIESWSISRSIRIAGWYEDIDVSGATPPLERPQLLAALNDLEPLRAGVLVAAKRDRLARDVVVVATLERIVADHGAVVRTSDGSSDASGPEGIVTKGVQDLFAQYERAVIRARTKAALAVKKRRGERIGRLPFGYALASDGVHLVHDDREQSIIRDVIRMRRGGATIAQIVRDAESAGHVARSGEPLQRTQIVRILMART